MLDQTAERIFQDDIIRQMLTNGWLLGEAKHYNRELALYTQDTLDFVQATQPEMWKKFTANYPSNPDEKFIELVAKQLNKADPNATSSESRKFGTLGVLRHELRDRNTRFSLCQFKPEHDLNPDTLANYQQNRLRLVPELVYSPWVAQQLNKGASIAEMSSAYTNAAIEQAKAVKSDVAKAWRIDLVLFVNGLPVATLELKSEFKQAVDRAVKQYKTTRLPVDPIAKKAEPLLTFKRGALVHFAVSQYQVFMTTKLAGSDTFFLPFNKGTSDGGAGNDTPEDIHQYATDYLWNEVLLPHNWLNILARFVHLNIEEKETWEGEKYKKESMIFPRYHQWRVVNNLLAAAQSEGPGQRYLIQHSAGSGKSNSIAWTAHQLSSLYTQAGKKLFDSVIVVTDRTVLDAQLQDTIYQFEHTEGVVGRINNQEGDGSKSEKLASALEQSQPIIIVTIQTFPFVLKAIANSAQLKERSYAIIADEAHSSQTGQTAKKLKDVLQLDASKNDEDELEGEDVISAAASQGNTNLSYFAFTATPKAKTLEMFGRCPNLAEPPSKTNKPEAFHVYSMRQAIEEGFILDVLKNYTNYKVAYKLALKVAEVDAEVESNRAKAKLNQWVRLHDHNISQKVAVIIEHFKEHVMGLLNGQAKAMVVTSSRKEAVRYKLAFDKYIHEKGYQKIHAMVAFSGEVEFTPNDPNSAGFEGEKFTEKNMNPGLHGRDMRKAFDSDDYQVMIVANKFQTGFDQPKLCAMYVDKKLGGVECVQTLSRLNRTYPSKAETGTFVLDFFNEPQEILDSFQPYYQTAELADVSDPNLIYELSDKLRAGGIFLWAEVEQFCAAFYVKNKTNAAVSNICKPAVERWTLRYKHAAEAFSDAKMIFDRTKKTGDAVLIANAENSLKECKKAKDTLEVFKKDLGSFVRFYDFMSQIVNYEDSDLEKLCLYARALRPMLREVVLDQDEIDLDNLSLSHYRLSLLRQQDLKLVVDAGEQLDPTTELGSGAGRDQKEEFLSQIIDRLNEIFVTDELTDKDMVNYAYTIRDKLSENKKVMDQIANNSPEQAQLGDFAKAFDSAIIDSAAANQNQTMQVMGDANKGQKFMKLVFDLLVAAMKEEGDSPKP